jgi:hypothetical protein
MPKYSDFYTGIGSRDTPVNILNVMADIASQMPLKLRTGDASGADKAFRDFSKDPKVFYLNWDAPLWTHIFTDHFHPNPKALSGYARKAMNRNACQILGEYGNVKSDCVICWTPDAKYVGGTAQAMKIADYFNIPIYNLDIFEDYRELCIDYNLQMKEELYRGK